MVVLSFVVPEASSRILGTHVPASDFRSAALWLGTALGAVALLQYLQLIQQRLETSVSTRLTEVLQRYTFRRCLALPMQWHLTNGPATANRSFFQDISNLSALASQVISMAVLPMVQIATVFLVMLCLNRTLAVVSLIPLGAMVLSAWLSMKAIPPAAASQIRMANALGKTFYDFVCCVRLVKALCMEPIAAGYIQTQIAESCAANKKLANVNALFSMLSGLAVSLGGLLVLGVGLGLLSQDELDLTGLLRFIFFAALLYQPFDRLSQFGQIYLQAKESWTNMCSTLSGERSQYAGPTIIHRFPRTPDIRAEGISFSFGGQQVLKSVRLVADEGEIVGITGRSGGGKTTLLSIIAGYLSPKYGSVLIGGTDVRNLSRRSIRENVFYAGQEAMLFNRSIRFNLLMARPNATEHMMWDVLDRAGMQDAVAGFPNQLDHIVGDHGSLLSGGERQRLLVALAWLRNPRVLLLDEITASLDSITDRQVRESVTTLMQGRTTIIVSHRLANLVPANKIYVLEAGTILAEGSHSSLLGDCAFYRQLWEARSA